MAKGGYKPGAGRPRKHAREPVEPPSGPVELRNQTPLEYMLEVMNDLTVDCARRDRMAIAAAPFVHSKPGESGKKDERAAAAKKAEEGRFAPAPPPPRLVVSNP